MKSFATLLIPAFLIFLLLRIIALPIRWFSKDIFAIFLWEIGSPSKEMFPSK